MGDPEKQNYLAVKDVSKLLKQIISKNVAGYYCVSWLHLFRTANKLKSHEGVCKGHDYCHMKIPEEQNNISEV